jgi:hypothetical protein
MVFIEQNIQFSPLRGEFIRSEKSTFRAQYVELGGIGLRIGFI